MPTSVLQRQESVKYSEHNDGELRTAGINQSDNQSTGLFIWQLVSRIEISVRQHWNAITQLHRDNQSLVWRCVWNKWFLYGVIFAH